MPFTGIKRYSAGPNGTKREKFQSKPSTFYVLQYLLSIFIRQQSHMKMSEVKYQE